MKVLLYSGGMDSWLIKRLWKPDQCVYVDMHTEYSEDEKKRLDADIRVIDFPLAQYELTNKIIPLRNLYLVMRICNEFPDCDLQICLGATAGDRVLDKSPRFAEAASNLLSYLWQPQHWTKGRKIEICLDFKSMTKTQILKKFIDEGGDIEEAWTRSFSCYDPQNGKPCWKCKPCFRKFVSFALCGKQFDEKTRETCLQYIRREILPDIEAGTYGRADEEKEIKEVLRMFGGKVYAVDFDDTLTEASLYPVTGKIKRDMVQKLKTLKACGNKIILFTSRTGAFLEEAVKLCAEQNLFFDEVYGGKPKADFYVDDRNMKPEELS